MAAELSFGASELVLVRHHCCFVVSRTRVSRHTGANMQQYPGDSALAGVRGDGTVRAGGRSRELWSRFGAIALPSDGGPDTKSIGGGHGILEGAGGSHGEPARSCVCSSAVLLAVGRCPREPWLNCIRPGVVAR